MLTKSQKQNNNDVINFFHEFGINMTHTINLPDFNFIRLEIQELWRWTILNYLLSLRVGKTPSPNMVNIFWLCLS